MTRKPRLKRKSFFVDERVLRQAKRALGVATDAEVIRRSVSGSRKWRSSGGS